MTIVVTPGPLPDDGTRIKVDPTLDAFVQGTVITNIGAEQFGSGADVSFVVTATDPPATSARTNGMLWYRRGEGVLYMWDNQQAAQGIALWVAVSNRKEMVVRVQSGPARRGSVMWLDSGGVGAFTEYHGIQVGANRMVMKVQATEGDSTLQSLRAYPVPPYLVCTSDVSQSFEVTGASGVGAGAYQTAVELGYCQARVYGGAGVGPGHGVLTASVPADAWLLSTAPYGSNNSFGAHVVGSGPPSGGLLLVFVRSTPASLVF